MKIKGTDSRLWGKFCASNSYGAHAENNFCNAKWGIECATHWIGDSIFFGVYTHLHGDSLPKRRTETGMGMRHLPSSEVLEVHSYCAYS